VATKVMGWRNPKGHLRVTMGSLQYQLLQMAKVTVSMYQVWLDMQKCPQWPHRPTFQ